MASPLRFGRRTFMRGAAGGLVLAALGCGSDVPPHIRPYAAVQHDPTNPDTPLPEEQQPSYDGLLADPTDQFSNFLYSAVMPYRDLAEVLGRQLPGNVTAGSSAVSAAPTISSSYATTMTWDRFQNEMGFGSGAPTPVIGILSLADVVRAAYFPTAREIFSLPDTTEARAASNALVDALVQNLAPHHDAQLYFGRIPLADGAAGGATRAYAAIPVVHESNPAYLLAVQGLPPMNSLGASVSPFGSGIDNMVTFTSYINGGAVFR
ncbi:hypothetical protein HYU19_03890 [Candidatus Woesearchaeota archaeon]|nr:hypothetical protein [Candidatus Woesearchaeota archaeon]